MSTIVVMPGGFHPFHAGHAALYNSARRAFPGAEVFVAATNDTSTRPFPFPVKEKLAKLAGVEAGHFVQVKSPFRAEEITAGFNPEKDVLIFVRSEKDAGSQPKPGGVKKDGSPAYLQPLEGVDRLEPFARHAYMAYLPTVEFGPGMKSATEIRTAWPQLNEKRKTALVMSLYPATQKNPALAANVVKMLDTAMGGELDEDMSRRGFLRGLGAAALAGSGVNALAQSPEELEQARRDNLRRMQQMAGAEGNTMPNVNPQQVELANKYYNALVQRAKDDGRELDRRTLNFLRAKADEAAAQKFQQSKPNPQQGFPAQGSERRVSKNIDNFESQYTQQGAGMTAGYQRRENQPVDENQGWAATYENEKPVNFDRDPELKQARLYAKQHYPEFSGDEDLAYDKWVQRSIKHGLEDDQKQFKILQGIATKIQKLENQIKQAAAQRAVAESDYIEEAARK